MSISVPSFAKINLGLGIGALRDDGFHELRTVYQTIALHDIIRVSIKRGSGIEIRCDDPRVPRDSTNTCWRVIECAVDVLKVRSRVTIEIEKHLPVQGGLGGASGNAVAALIALERALKKQLSGADRLRIAAQVGSDLPLFLIGGTALGVGRGEEVYPLPDLPAMPCVIALPDTAVSTPKAFAEWDALMSESMTGKGTPSSRANHLSAANDCTLERRALSENRIPDEASKKQVPRLGNSSASGRVPSLGMTDWSKDENEKLTSPSYSDRMLEFSREISAWLSAGPSGSGRRRSGVSASRGGRAENPLLDLVRTGIENDFERVVFPQYPELRRVKSVLEQAGARYASLSGSGSALYGLFASRARAAVAAKRLTQQGTRAVVTSTLTRRQYWKKLQISD